MNTKKGSILFMLPKDSKTCILVLGMHRSGTSTMSGVLGILGVELSKKLIESHTDNPKGFFEHKDIVELNKELLSYFGIDSDGLFSKLPKNWQEDYKIGEFKKQIKVIIERDFADTNLFLIKDPRISILLKVYIEIFNELNINTKFVVMRRNVQDVVLSLYKRNKISTLEAINTYRYYYQNIDSVLYNTPHLDFWYDNFFENYESAIKNITDFFADNGLEKTFNSENIIKSFLDINLRHNKVSSEDFLTDLLSGLMEQKDAEQKEIISLYEERLEILSNQSQDSLQKIIGSYEAKLEEKDVLVNKSTALLKGIQKIKDDYKSDIEILKKEVEYQKELVHKNFLHSQYQKSLIDSKDNEILNLNIALTNIEQSFTWKIVKGWDMFLNLFFPRGSFIRKQYEKILSFNQKIFNELIPGILFKSAKKVQKNKPSYTDEFWKRNKENFSNIDVLFITHDESRTGAPRIIFDVAKASKEKYKVAMVSLARGSMTQDFSDEFGTVMYPDELYGELEPVDQAKKILEKIKPKVVYANSIGSHPFCIAAKELNIPTIFHVHELDIAINMMFRGQKRKDFKSFADIFIAVSVPVYNILINSLNCEQNKVVLINAFVDSEKNIQKSNEISEYNILSELKKKEDEIIVMSVGMFIYRKGADIFMRTAKSLVEKGLPVKFIWVGSKPFKEPFMSDFAFYSPFFTLISEKVNPFPYMKQADIFALPSREDPFPLVVLESMSLGKPAVIFKEAGGIHSAVKDAGTIVEEFNEKDFADAIENLVLDKQKRIEMGNKAIHNQKKYDSKVLLPKIQDLIDDIFSKSNSLL